MRFDAQRLSAEFIQDERVRAVVQASFRNAASIVRPFDLLAEAFQVCGPKLLATIQSATRPDCSLDELVSAINSARINSPYQAVTSPRENNLSPAAHDALEEFSAILRRSGGVLDSVALELLLHVLLKHLDGADRQKLPMLEVDMAAQLFRSKVAEAMNPSAISASAFEAEPPSGHSPSEAADKPFLLPSTLVASNDLTHWGRSLPRGESYPFDGDPHYDRFFDSVARILHRRSAHHVFAVGERGVGKSTLVAEMARRAASGQINFLAERRFIMIDGRYIPVDESRQRLSAILAHVINRPDLIVCIDGLPALLRGERGSNKSVFLAEVAHSRCQFIGILTPREYEELIADDPDYADFFCRVDVDEPAPETAAKLLAHYALGMEQRYGLTIEPGAVRQALTLSANYILNDQLPAKALKILHRVCEDLDFERSRRRDARHHVTADDVVRVVAELSGIPEETLLGIAERTDYEKSLSEMIFGQKDAIREVATELGLIKAGMTDSGKPASVMLFLGQTGTGKTEMAKALARFYSTSKRLKVYTLGNCVEPHSVATIIGVPPGYVGNDQGGRLVNELNSDPYCVFLLDEADKAHPDVLQPFLNLFDEGWVADQRGVRGYANKSIFILTTNVGQRMIAEMHEQKKPREEIAARMKEALSQIRHTKSDRPVFTPEFVSRIKRVIVFSPLDLDAMMAIARKLSAETQKNWIDKRGKQLHIFAPLVEKIAAAAHQLNGNSKGKEGGRVVRKLFADWVEAPLQREVSRRPDDYRRCASIMLSEASPPPVETDPLLRPSVQVEFRFRD